MPAVEGEEEMLLPRTESDKVCERRKKGRQMVQIQ